MAIPLMATLDAQLLERGKQLRLIQQFGVGLEGVDLEAARTMGIEVANVPSEQTGNAVSVAEWVLLLMLALARDYPGQANSIEQRRLGIPVGKTLYGKLAAIVGLGNLGAAIAERLKALGMQVWGIKKRPELSTASSSVIDFLGGLRDLGKVLTSADFVILTVPLRAETQSLIGRAELARMKPSAFLVNVARGPVVSYDALIWALENKVIAGAGLDVFWSEPVAPDDPIFNHNVIASPHIAGVTDYSMEQIARRVAQNIHRVRMNQ